MKYEFLVNHANDKLRKHKQNQEQIRSVKVKFEEASTNESKLTMYDLVLF